ncbi:MAG: ribulose-phosphate 3-epimerase [Clostridiales bacterium]|nr:ribulose-phosphate 3-epimerase [Clostridiales bacterium]
MIKLSPSLLSADFSKLADEIAILDQEQIPYLHLDIMDGNFVPNITYGAPVVKQIRKCTDMVFDVHLMIREPLKFVEDFKNAGADIYCFHVECESSIGETILAVKKAQMKVGLALRPKTPVDLIKKYLPEVDMVLVMSVEPGFGGQKFMPETLEKARQLKELKRQNNYTYEIEMDGGLKQENCSLAIEAGVEVIVAGSAVFGGDVAEKIRGFQRIFREQETK